MGAGIDRKLIRCDRNACSLVGCSGLPLPAATATAASVPGGRSGCSGCSGMAASLIMAVAAARLDDGAADPGLDPATEPEWDPDPETAVAARAELVPGLVPE